MSEEERLSTEDVEALNAIDEEWVGEERRRPGSLAIANRENPYNCIEAALDRVKLGLNGRGINRTSSSPEVSLEFNRHTSIENCPVRVVC